MRRVLNSPLFRIIVVAVLAAITLNLVLAVARLGRVNEGEYALVEEAYFFLEKHFIDPLPDQLEIEQGMVEGMVNALEDPYSVYVEPSTHEIQQDDLVGEYGGIGTYIARNEQGEIYLVPFEGSPAEDAGLIEGDILLEVDGVSIDPDNIDTISAALRGPEGSFVRVTVAPRSTSEGTLSFDIERKVFPLQSVTSFLHPSAPTTGVLVIGLFSERTRAELDHAFDALIDRGATTFILDLRNNGGGLLDSALKVAEVFLEEGDILHERSAEDELVTYSVDLPGKGSSVPLAVLVNQYTASAAEVVAGAIQDHDRAPLIGARTFGKGSVQVIVELQDGSSLHITSARWYTPNMRSLDGVGLMPDFEVIESGVGDQTMEFAINWLKEQ